jgi:hypothetical protein
MPNVVITSFKLLSSGLSMREVVAHFLNKDPKKRPKAEELLEHK